MNHFWRHIPYFFYFLSALHTFPDVAVHIVKTKWVCDRKTSYLSCLFTILSFWIVEALTDNKNRTASKLRTIFQKNGGNLGTQGSAAHNFKQIGVIRIDINEIKDDKIFELAIDAGADECFSLENFHEIHCGFEDIYSIKKKIESHVENFISTDIEWIPLNKVYNEGENKESIKKLIELLDDDDDVQRVYSNFGEED